MQKNSKTKKMKIGDSGEKYILNMINEKTDDVAINMNKIKNNYPVIDLVVLNKTSYKYYGISVKAKKTTKAWPRVSGIKNKNQYIIFVDYYLKKSPDIYILGYSAWITVLETILPERNKKDPGAKIVDGAIEWHNFKNKNGKFVKRYRGSLIRPEEIKRYKDNWNVLPGVSG